MRMAVKSVAYQSRRPHGRNTYRDAPVVSFDSVISKENS